MYISKILVLLYLCHLGKGKAQEQWYCTRYTIWTSKWIFTIYELLQIFIFTIKRIRLISRALLNFYLILALCLFAVSQSYDYSNSTAAASVMQGEPPPPGTDLDLLLAAPPPPPPPPDDDNSTVALQAYNTSAPLSALSQPLSYTGLDGDPMVHSSVADSMYPSESGLMSEESTYGSERNDASPLISQEPIIIARPPQVFSKDEPGSSTSAEVVSGTESAVQESLSEEVTPAATTPQAVAAELPSSSGIASEKKKKKKDKVL